MGVRIVGWGHTKFGRLEDNLEQLIVRSAREAIDHAGVDPADIDAVIFTFDELRTNFHDRTGAPSVETILGRTLHCPFHTRKPIHRR